MADPATFSQGDLALPVTWLGAIQPRIVRVAPLFGTGLDAHRPNCRPTTATTTPKQLTTRSRIRHGVFLVFIRGEQASATTNQPRGILAVGRRLARRCVQN